MHSSAARLRERQQRLAAAVHRAARAGQPAPRGSVSMKHYRILRRWRDGSKCSAQHWRAFTGASTETQQLATGGAPAGARA